MKLRLVIMTAILSSACLAGAQDASVPPLMNYQGKLTDEGGGALEGTHDLTFNIYAEPVASGGETPVWGPQVFTAVTLVDGRFNVILSTDTGDRSIAEAFGDAERFLGVQVDEGAEVSPRQQILSAPYALKAEVAAMASAVVAGGVTTDMLADQAVTQAKREPANVVKASEQAIEFSVTGVTYVDVPGQLVSITTTGRPVFVGMEMANVSRIGILEIVRNTDGTDTVVGRTLWVYENAMPLSIWALDQPAAGTHTYRARLNGMVSGETGFVTGRLVATEL